MQGRREAVRRLGRRHHSDSRSPRRSDASRRIHSSPCWGRVRTPTPRPRWTSSWRAGSARYVRALVQESAWVGKHENIFVLRPIGVGKSFVASALVQKACRDGYSALYTLAQLLFRDLAMARADGSLRNLVVRLARIDVLVIDDWALAPLSEPERRDFWKICEDRYQVRSTVLTSRRSRAGTSRSAIPHWPMVSSTAWFTTLTGLRCAAIPCARIVEGPTPSDDDS